MSGRDLPEELRPQVAREKSPQSKDLEFENAPELFPSGHRFFSRFFNISPLSTRLMENPQIGIQDPH